MSWLDMISLHIYKRKPEVQTWDVEFERCKYFPVIKGLKKEAV